MAFFVVVTRLNSGLTKSQKLSLRRINAVMIEFMVEIEKMGVWGEKVGGRKIAKKIFQCGSILASQIAINYHFH